MQIKTFEIIGVSPILMNNPAAMGGGGAGLKSKKTYVDSEEAEIRVYRNRDNHIVVPTIAFRSAMLKAASGRKIGKATARAVIAGSVFPVEQNCILLDTTTEKPIDTYEIHRCRVVVNKAGVVRARPMIQNWKTKLALEIDVDMIQDDTIIPEILNLAGKIVGIMDWRVEKLGTYGRFRV